jgi:hypothetical protein
MQPGFNPKDDDAGYKYAYSKDVTGHDRELLAKRGKELGFPVVRHYSVPSKYPDVYPLIDMRKKIKSYGLGLKVLNVGVGPKGGESELARQLPFFSFKQLDILDISKSYIVAAETMAWNSENMNFIHGDILSFDKLNDYDLILLLDILEYLPKEAAMKLLDSRPDKIIFVPLSQVSPNHISLWTEQEFMSRGFRTELVEGYHHGDFVCDSIWATKLTDPTETKS